MVDLHGLVDSNRSMFKKNIFKYIVFNTKQQKHGVLYHLPSQLYLILINISIAKRTNRVL